ncbi:NAD(P)-dependent oxidoreductase [Hymenobacter sp. BT175]|uniref:NAD-dependent epimerase/dehydratase family protein n=1 Tax=Hymenobacter translucens TaxID=2886507 RepID=UPI001D0E05EC|nr:NAD(P)-dependent oxidoreductase [Hymenobacter translucens]MCC2547922.1 NAD(P)-dependent oxidoreductase [Hymenobacter translucens]
MSQGRVLLTGATGFIGSHIAEALLQAGHEVLALHRTSSDRWRLAGVAGPLTWINSDDANWEQVVVSLRPEFLVHSAWLGVSASQRDDWESQLTNLSFTLQLLKLVAQGPIRRVVALGSQAEYGLFHGRVDEASETSPTSAYGAVKLATLEVLKAFCQGAGMEWCWLRVFSVFGPREDKHWFVSFVVDNLLANQPTNLTACEQQYDYMFVRDLARAVTQVVGAEPGTSGVYNVSSNTATSLKTIVSAIQELTSSRSVINYGAVPYRPGQVMHMEGNSNRFRQVFGEIQSTPLPEALAEVINFVRLNK